MQIDISSARQDKFGFYQVGDFRTYSKFEAIEQHVKTGQKLLWRFNDEVFSSYDWSQEPTESLRELYRQRAQQLRDQYDYIVLWFSGGADCTNILNSFIDNDIKLDEVASQVNYDATGDKFNFLNAEIFNVASVVAESAKQQQPWLRHTVIDLCKMATEYFANKGLNFDWIYHANSYVNPNNTARRDIKLSMPHWTKMFNEGKKVAFVSGIDKPRVNGVNGQYFFKFADLIESVNAESQTLNRDWEFNELFYWTPDCPKIVIKQAHVIKNYLKLCSATSPFITDDIKLTNNITTTIGKKIYYLTSHGIHTLIYPKWVPVLYQFKPRSIPFTERDSWFFNLPDSDPAKYAWKAGLEHRWKSTPEIFKQDANNIYRGFKNISSKIYSLGT